MKAKEEASYGSVGTAPEAVWLIAATLGFASQPPDGPKGYGRWSGYGEIGLNALVGGARMFISTTAVPIITVSSRAVNVHLGQGGAALTRPVSGVTVGT